MNTLKVYLEKGKLANLDDTEQEAFRAKIEKFMAAKHKMTVRVRIINQQGGHRFIIDDQKLTDERLLLDLKVDIDLILYKDFEEIKKYNKQKEEMTFVHWLKYIKRVNEDLSKRHVIMNFWDIWEDEYKADCEENGWEVEDLTYLEKV